MPLLPFLRAVIDVPVSDRQLGDTLIRQRARFQTLTHHQDAAGECSARITVLVCLFAADGDGYGPPLSGPGFTSYPAELTAANDTLVDAADGSILAMQEGRNPADWQAHIDTFSQNTMLQGDFFEYLRENAPVLIGDMIRQHIAQADAMGCFA